MSKRGRVLTIPTPLGKIELPPLPPLPFPPLPKKALGSSSNPLEVATPEITLTVLGTDWDVEVSVMVNMAGETRPAKADEVESRIRDTGEGFDYKIYNQTPWWKTDASGKVYFDHETYPWLVGFNGAMGANRMYIDARLTGAPEVSAEKHMLLGRTGWSDPQ